MKKILAMVMALIVLTMTFAAVAEAKPYTLTEVASGFDLTCVVPEGATVTSEINGDSSYNFFSFADETKPLICLSIAPSEEYDDRNLSDLNEDELKALFETMTADYDAPVYKMETTASGYKYMIISEDASEVDIEVFFMMRDGWFIQMTINKADFSELADADLACGADILNSLDVVETSAAK